MEVKDCWMIPTQKKIASGSQERLNEKTLVFLNTFINSSLYSLKPFANPATVFLSPRVSAVSTSPSLTLSQAFLATGCVLCH